MICMRALIVLRDCQSLTKYQNIHQDKRHFLKVHFTVPSADYSIQLYFQHRCINVKTCHFFYSHTGQICSSKRMSVYKLYIFLLPGGWRFFFSPRNCRKLAFALVEFCRKVQAVSLTSVRWRYETSSAVGKSEKIARTWKQWSWRRNRNGYRAQLFRGIPWRASSRVIS